MVALSDESCATLPVTDYAPVNILIKVNKMKISAITKKVIINCDQAAKFFLNRSILVPFPGI